MRGPEGRRTSILVDVAEERAGCGLSLEISVIDSLGLGDKGREDVWKALWNCRNIRIPM